MIDGLTIQYLLTAMTLATIGVVALHRVGALWLRLALIDLLAAFLVKRIDAIGAHLGIDLVSDNVSDLISFLAILAVLFAFWAANQRRVYLMQAERERQADLKNRHGATLEQLERLRVHDEIVHRQPWETISTHHVG
jgi:hypothetical protein